MGRSDAHAIVSGPVGGVLFGAIPSLVLAEDVPAPDPAPQADTVAAKDAVFTQEQLDQMLAPIALYPDALLAQVLMASTYPGQVNEAVTWSKANPRPPATMQ